MTIESGSPSSGALSFAELTRSFPMTFSCKYFPFSKEEKDEALRVIKESVLGFPYVKAEFEDDSEYTFRFYHQEREIQALISCLSIDKYFNKGSISYTLAPKSMSFYAPSVIFTQQDEGYEDFKVAMKSTLEDAQRFYESRDVVTVSIPDECQATTSKMFSALLEGFDGICVGEMYHSDCTPKAQLINQMEELYDLGVRTLYLEHVFYDTMYQPLAENKTTPSYIDRYLRGLDSGQRVESSTYTFRNLVNKAHEVGIRVVPIDTCVSYACGNTRRGGIKCRKDRIVGMNYVATRIIEEEQKRDGAGKYIALMGISHLAECIEGIPGVSELLGVPSILMTDGTKHVMEYNHQSEELRKPVTLFLQNKVARRMTRKRAISTESEESPVLKRQKQKVED